MQSKKRRMEDVPSPSSAQMLPCYWCQIANSPCDGNRPCGTCVATTRAHLCFGNIISTAPSPAATVQPATQQKQQQQQQQQQQQATQPTAPAPAAQQPIATTSAPIAVTQPPAHRRRSSGAEPEAWSTEYGSVHQHLPADKGGLESLLVTQQPQQQQPTQPQQPFDVQDAFSLNTQQQSAAPTSAASLSRPASAPPTTTAATTTNKPVSVPTPPATTTPATRANVNTNPFASVAAPAPFPFFSSDKEDESNRKEEAAMNGVSSTNNDFSYLNERRDISPFNASNSPQHQQGITARQDNLNMYFMKELCKMKHDQKRLDEQVLELRLENSNLTTTLKNSQFQLMRLLEYFSDALDHNTGQPDEEALASITAHMQRGGPRPTFDMTPNRRPPLAITQGPISAFHPNVLEGGTSSSASSGSSQSTGASNSAGSNNSWNGSSRLQRTEQPVVVYDISKGTATVLTANATFCELVGYNMEEVIGKPWNQFIPPDAVARTMGVLRQTDLKSGVTVTVDQMYKHKYAGFFTTRDTHKVLFGQDGSPISDVVTVTLPDTIEPIVYHSVYPTTSTMHHTTTPPQPRRKASLSPTLTSPTASPPPPPIMKAATDSPIVLTSGLYPVSPGSPSADSAQSPLSQPWPDVALQQKSPFVFPTTTATAVPQQSSLSYTTTAPTPIPSTTSYPSFGPASFTDQPASPSDVMSDSESMFPPLSPSAFMNLSGYSDLKVPLPIISSATSPPLQHQIHPSLRNSSTFLTGPLSPLEPIPYNPHDSNMHSMHNNIGSIPSSPTTSFLSGLHDSGEHRLSFFDTSQLQDFGLSASPPLPSQHPLMQHQQHQQPHHHHHMRGNGNNTTNNNIATESGGGMQEEEEDTSAYNDILSSLMDSSSMDLQQKN